ncbi:hypothetical protein L218DRAFT_154153 [Marasmius fiardii PR-910]|nr:hypothetical protein L218DRAFT_153816 [Marasmius fiardii PR-910]KAF9265666.1 hypothetical protein L218DRAFT_154153 [Marasmius fiardii PR-910]
MAAPEGNAGGTQPVITVDIATAVGPIFIANLLNWLLMGTLIMQVYTYYRRFAKDRTWIRVLVAVLFSLDIAHTCLLTAHGWFFTIEIWGQFDRLDEIPWSAEMIPFMCGLVSCIVQLFYAWRIWVLSSKYKFLRLLAVLVVMLSLMQGLSAMIAAIILLINSDQQNLLRLHPAFSVWLAGSFVTDIMITSSMSYILYKAKEASKWAGSETMLTRMINNTIQTGAVTVVCALIDLVLFTKYIQTTYHQVPAYVLGKL